MYPATKTIKDISSTFGIIDDAYADAIAILANIAMTEIFLLFVVLDNVFILSLPYRIFYPTYFKGIFILYGPKNMLARNNPSKNAGNHSII